MSLDPETKQLINDAEHVENMLQSQGWSIIKGKLDAKILDLQNINNIDLEKPETLAIQLAGRKMASDLLFAWLGGDVYGFAEQQRANNIQKPEQGSEIIDRSST